jgi:hypothetical protein
MDKEAFFEEIEQLLKSKRGKRWEQEVLENGGLP